MTLGKLDVSGLVGKIHFGDLNPYGFPRLGMGERNTDACLSGGPEYGTLAVNLVAWLR
jgi:hypothetical protein